ncbi:MAG: hypothetical protein QG567_2408 [Campylobacterota bacterium]|nr:hypothetical protein [Campylobacterota bacterium]
MKKRALTAVLLLLTTNLYPCGGCVDSPFAYKGAELIKKTFDSSDATLAMSFDKQVELVNEMLKSEIQNQKIYSNIVNIQIDSTVELKSLDFKQNQHIFIEAQ